MPRLLICGDVLGKFDVLFKRCDTLSKSKAGPFDMILVAGAFFADDGSGDMESVVEALNTSPLPLYFCDPTGAPAGLLDIPNIANVEWPVSLEAAPSVHWLGSGGVVMVGTLTVAFLSPGDSEVGLKKIEELCSKGVYMGADLLLTPEWPAGLASTLPPNGPHTALESLGVHIDGVGATSAADAAKYSRPRYHFSSSENVFYQRQPYRCRADAGSAISTNRQSCITRFIGLGTVETGKTVKDRKWLHALQLEAIPFMSVESLKEEPAGTTDSPFQLHTSKVNQVMGVKEAKEVGEELPDRADTGAFFFGADKKGAGKMGGNKRKKQDDGENEDNDTLYLGPLPPGVTGDGLRSQLCSVIPGIDGVLLSVNVPNNKTFGFAQFKSHESAKEAMYALEGLQFVKAKWGKPREDKGDRDGGDRGGGGPPLPPGPPPKKPNNMEDTQEQLATYSNVLFLGFPSPPPVNGTSPDEACALLQVELSHSLSTALPSLAASLESKAVKAKAFPGKTYAFLEFDTHDSALAALPSFEGLALEFCLGEGYGDTIPVTAKWGKPKQQVAPRPKFEADSRVDCWFCLASSTCEAHLVASIANDLYLTLPKGSLCEGHCLAIPIPHGGNHAQLSEAGHSELLSYKQALSKCFYTSYGGAGMVVFERYADTRGTYHMHQQVVPVSGNMIGATKTAFERSGKRQNLEMKEIQSDVDLKEIGDDFYFYVEIWAPGAAAASFPTCRLLHRAKDSRIPVQFGREVLAGVLGRPERAFWKACEVGKEAETESAEAFKQIFANFDPFSA